MTEKEKKNREELLKLIRENPDLPTVAMVDAELIGDDYGRYLGSWGSAFIDDYLITSDDRVCFKSDDDIFDVLEHCMTDEELETLPESEKECRPYYDNLPWTKAIIVYINPPRQEKQA